MTHSAPNIDAQTFVENLVRSGLLEPAAMARLSAEGPDTEDGLELARFLVRKEMLTRFQAERLLAGRCEGFHLGQYRLLEEIGRGGMGRVYKALHLTMRRIVALKILSAHYTQTEQARELFRREVRAVAKLNHPNIVAAFDANQTGETCFLVMEYVDGLNLAELVRERGPLPIDQACEFIRQTAVGLEYAHELNLIHRDIKPANLLVQTTAIGPSIKILDFGLARINDPGESNELSEVSGEFTVMGTPDYVSPEQCRDKRSVDQRSDLYSLGCTFYFLLTGGVPFPGGTPVEKILRHYSEKPKDIRYLRPEIPELLARIVEKLLSKKADDRYASARDLINAMNRLALTQSDWKPPAPNRPKSQRDSGLRASIEETDPWANLGEGSVGNTLANTGISTRETPTVPRPGRSLRIVQRQRRNDLFWILLSTGVLTTVCAGLFYLMRFVTNP